MSPRIALPDPAPPEKLLRLLDEEERAAQRLAEKRQRLDVELRALSSARGLTVKLSADDVRQELRVREQVGG